MERRVWKILQMTFILLTIGMSVHAQPVLVKEVLQGSTNFMTIGDLVYFTSEGSLYRTDGTAGGTILLASGFNEFKYFTEFNGMAFFVDVGPEEIWRSDGTPSGTILLKTFGGTDNLIMADQTPNYLFFKGFDSATGLELYRTDGTPGGTIMIKDIRPGTGHGFNSSATAMGNYLFFGGNNGTSGEELWKSDGTAAGTVLVKDIWPGTPSGFSTSSAISASNFFYFVGYTSENGSEPWVSDGTEEGTILLRDITPGAENTYEIGFRLSYNEDVYFYSTTDPYGDEPGATLWKTSGTPSSTVKVTNAFEDGYSHYLSNFFAYQGKVYFVDHSDGDISCWVTDGTPEGTRGFFDLTVGDGYVPFFEGVNNHVLFYLDAQDAYNPPYKFERSDGTPEGTQTFDIFKSGVDGGPRDVTKVNDMVFYGDHDQEEAGQAEEDDHFQLIQSDGFTTQAVRDIYGGSYVGTRDIVNYNGKVVFTTIDDRYGESTDNKRLWIYDPASPPVEHFTLVNADTDKDLQRINNGDVITKDSNINIRYTPVETPGSVVFHLNNVKTRTETAPPYSLAGDVNGNYAPWQGAKPGTYKLTATPYSEAGGKGTAGTPFTVNFTIQSESGGEDCTASGTILREQWNSVSGNNVSAIPVNSQPNSTSQLNIFEGPANSQTNFGARIRGWICPPVTGNYTFWIASNDNSELWLSTDIYPMNRVKIASVTGATTARQWTKFPSQKSAAIALTSGKRYYIEALHKQGAGSHNIAVGWQLPDGSLERPIPGRHLSPVNPSDNLNPVVVSITNPENGQTFHSPATITIHANASDYDEEISFVDFFQKNVNGHWVHLGQDGTAPYSVIWSDVQPGDYIIYVEATSVEGDLGVHQIMIEVTEQCTASGTITRDYWANVSGARVSDIPVNSPPTSSSEINIFEGPSNIGSNYATRIRGYLCPPATGNYTFWIASNDHSELWLSTDDDPSNKIRIAFITGATGIREWTKFASQQSAPIALAQGQRYYIEALHKQGVGTDNIAVGWRLPNGTLERPVPGNHLSPFEMNSARMASNNDDDRSAEKALYSQINIYPNPVQSGDPELTIAGYERVEVPVETHIEIINMTGEVVFADRILCGGNCSSYVMSVNKQLVPGVYLINMKTKDTRLSKRLLVK